MDIVIPSNFERFLYHLLDENPHELTTYMAQIKMSGKFDFASQKEQRVATIRGE